MKTTVRCIVTGRVQGVFFRESTRSVARELEITGHAINLPNGSVEVIAQGDASHLEKLKAYLETGPQYARVDSVVCESIAAIPATDEFVTG